MGNQLEATRRIERAEIERWFSSDALEAFFHAADGRAWPIEDGQVARGKARAFALVDAMLDGGRRDILLTVAGAVMAGFLMPRVVPHALQGYAIGGIGLALFVAMFAASTIRLALYRRRLRRLRGEMTAAMVGPPLLAADPARFARTNLFRVLQYVWILALLLGMVALRIGMGPALLPSLRAAGAAVTLLVIGVAMGGAWALYYAAEQVDRVQARPKERRSRLPYSTRDSWSQAD